MADLDAEVRSVKVIEGGGEVRCGSVGRRAATDRSCTPPSGEAANDSSNAASPDWRPVERVLNGQSAAHVAADGAS